MKKLGKKSHDRPVNLTFSEGFAEKAKKFAYDLGKQSLSKYVEELLRKEIESAAEKSETPPLEVIEGDSKKSVGSSMMDTETPKQKSKPRTRRLRRKGSRWMTDFDTPV